MKKNRIKLPTTPAIQTRDEAEVVVSEIQAITIKQNVLARKMDEALAHVKDGFEPYLKKYSDALQENTVLLHDWARAHPEEFKDKKSIQFSAGTLGFRTGTPKLALLSRKWTWDKVLSTLITLGQKAYIRLVEDVDKEKIIAAARANPDKDGAALALAAYGTKVIQEESFFVDPDLSPIQQTTKIKT